MGQFGIGQPVRRFEDKRLLSGNGRFQNDVNLPGQAYGYVLRSPHAHARDRARSTSTAALAAPGVLAIYTGDDLAAAGLGTMGVPFSASGRTARRCSGGPISASPRAGCAMSASRSPSSSPRAWRRPSDAAELVDDRLRDPAVGHRHRRGGAPASTAVWDECPDNISNLLRERQQGGDRRGLRRAPRISSSGAM